MLKSYTSALLLEEYLERTKNAIKFNYISSLILQFIIRFMHLALLSKLYYCSKDWVFKQIFKCFLYIPKHTLTVFFVCFFISPKKFQNKQYICFLVF